MSTTSGVVDIQSEDTVTHFSLDAMKERVQRVVVKSQEAVAAAMHAVQKAMANLAERGPGDYARIEDIERRLSRVEHRPHLNGGHGAVHGNGRLVTILVALNTALLIGVGGWVLTTVARHDRQLAVIECQLSPTCRLAVARGTP